MTQLSPTLPNGDSSRKRPRSVSGSSSTSGASSPKRAASDSPAPATLSTLISISPNVSIPLIPEKDVDTEMQTQGESLSLTEASAPPMDTAAPSLTPAEKLRKVQELKRKPLALGDTWYIISRTWYRNWESACGGAQMKGAPSDESQVSAIDNSAIAGSRPGKLNGLPLEDGISIELVPKEAWDLLVSWYGEPNHTFGRQVIAEGLNKTLRIEFYPVNFSFYLSRSTNPPPPKHHEFSKAVTLDAITDIVVIPVLSENGGQEQPYRIWRVDSSKISSSDDDEQQGYTPERVAQHHGELCWGSYNPILNVEHTTLEEAFIGDGDRLVLELQEDGVFKVPLPSGPTQRTQSNAAAPAEPIHVPLSLPSMITADYDDSPLFGPGPHFFDTMEASTSAAASPSKEVTKIPPPKSATSSFALVRSSSQPISRPRGTCGLNNLGNTCFMNSALQCLAHLPELTEYFLTGVFQAEINPDNPLSTGGELARSYGALLQNLFDPTGAGYSVAPRDFKLKISRHAPAFSGYAQHDTQELLAFLLDGLHEDLNRIRKKPYVENPDWEGGGDKEMVELARQFWDGYKKRNDSVIVDLFQGQYKSTLVCPECNKVSITFDPFMYLTLPLPVDKSWEHDVYFVTWGTSTPNYKARVSISRNSTFKDIKNVLAKWFDANPENILAAEIFQSRIYRFFPDYHGVSDVADGDILFFYELPISAQQSANPPKRLPTDPLVLPIWTVSPTPRYGTVQYRYGNKSKEAIGYPFFVAIPPEDAGDMDKIYCAIVDRYSQATNLSRDLYIWSEESEDDEDDAVMVTAPQSEVSSVNGDPISTDNAEGPDDDMEEVTLPSYEKVAKPGTRVVQGPPKSDLFSWYVMGDNFDPSVKNNMGSHFDAGNTVTEEWRKHTADPEAGLTGLLRPGDGIVCDWDEQLRDYYFGGGSRGGGSQARWNETVEYVDQEMKAASEAKNKKQKSGITLDDCLNEFVKEEKLGEADPWYCPRCKKHQQATKKFDIWKVPDILVVHLKRFSNSRLLRDKIDVLVNFPTQGLDLTSRVEERIVIKRLAEEGVDIGAADTGEEPLLYDLFAVDEHMGGLGGGHYRAYAKNDDDGKWYHFDDARVDVSSAEASVTPYAYLLFYRRRTDKPVGGETVEKIKAAKEAPPVLPPSPPPEPPLASSSKGIQPQSVMLRPASDLPRTHSISMARVDDTPDTSPRSSNPPSLDYNDFSAMGPHEADDTWGYAGNGSPFTAASDGVGPGSPGHVTPWTANASTPSPVVSEDDYGEPHPGGASVLVNPGHARIMDENYDECLDAPVQDIIVEEGDSSQAESEQRGPHS